jgi:hypothetical protein
VLTASGKPRWPRNLANLNLLVSNYETGERRLDLLELHAVCEALGIPLLEFLQRFTMSSPINRLSSWIESMGFVVGGVQIAIVVCFLFTAWRGYRDSKTDQNKKAPEEV